MSGMLNVPTSPRRHRGRLQARVARAISAGALFAAVFATLFAAVSSPAWAKAEPTTSAPSAQVAAASQTFWAYDWGANTYSQVRAEQRYEGDHVIVYVDESQVFSNFLVNALGTAFDSVVYPAVVEAYGSAAGSRGIPR